MIDYFAAKRCGPAVGDLTATFRGDEPGAALSEIEPIGSVRLFAETRLLELLVEAGVGLRLAGPVFARHPAVTLDRPELWIDFLDRPGAVEGKGLLSRSR